MLRPCWDWADEHPGAPRCHPDGLPWTEVEERILTRKVGRVHDDLSDLASRRKVPVVGRYAVDRNTMRMQLFDGPYECAGSGRRAGRRDGSDSSWVMRDHGVCSGCIQGYARSGCFFARPDDSVAKDMLMDGMEQGESDYREFMHEQEVRALEHEDRERAWLRDHTAAISESQDSVEAQQVAEEFDQFTSSSRTSSSAGD